MVLVTLFSTTKSVYADEVILDESLTEMQKVGDFDVSTFMSPIDLAQQGLLTDGGEIDAGQLYRYFKSCGLNSVYELNLCLDINSEIQADDNLNLSAIEFRIEDLNSDADQIYRLGDNILKLPGYEASDMKPEAGITIKLDYDFMQQFDEYSTEKLKFTVDGKEIKSIPVSVAFLARQNYFSLSRLVFVVAFAAFWIFVFMVLFRMTLPRDRNVASPA